MEQECGRVPEAPGSREPSPDGLGPSGFDPSRVLAALKDGCRTGMIAERLGLSMAKTRRILNRMEREGYLYRDDRASAVNCIRWQPVPGPRDSDGSGEAGYVCGKGIGNE